MPREKVNFKPDFLKPDFPPKYSNPGTERSYESNLKKWRSFKTARDLGKVMLDDVKEFAVWLILYEYSSVMNFVY